MSANPFAALGFGSDSEDEGAPKVAAPKAKAAEVKKADAKPAATNARAKSAPAKKDSGREASDPDTARKTDTRARDANKRGAAENREKRNRDRAPREDGEKAPRAPRAPRDGEKNMDRHSRRGPSDQKREQRGGEGKGNWGSAKDTVVPAADDAAADVAEAPVVATPVEPEAPAPKEFSYEEYMSMKKVGASLPELPKARAAGEGDKGAVPMGTAITRKEKETPVVAAERKLAQKEKAEIVFGVKSYSSTQREERPERPASRGTERGARGGAARGGARGGAPRGGASAGAGFNLEADFPGLGKN